MIEQVNAALTELQGALVARALYPSEHPLIRSHEEHALTLLEEVFRDQPEISMFAVDNRVVYRNQVLPSSPSLTETLFRALHLCGVDRLTLRAGVDLTELESFLDSLVDSVSGKKTALVSSAHLGVSSLHDLDEQGFEGLADVKADELGSNAAGALSDAWGRMDSGDPLNTEVLRDIVSALSKAVSESAGGILPLAPLKQHDEYTFVHTINVTLLSTAMAQVLGFSDRAVHELSLAAMLHDIGKRAIPHEVLNKQGLYTEEDFAVMKRHPVEGARMLIGTPNIPEIAAIVAFEHHIRADGSGYPRVTRDWRLNLASRVVQLADVFDALRTDRPYRPGKSVPQIIQLMKQDVNTFFDADLLLIFFLEVVSRGIPAAPPSAGAAAASGAPPA